MRKIKYILFILLLSTATYAVVEFGDFQVLGDLIVGGDIDTGDGAEITQPNSGTLNIVTTGSSQTVNIGSSDSTLGFNGTTTLSTAKVSTELQLLNEAPIKLYETGGSNYTAIKAPSSLTGNTTLTLPDGDGTNGQVIKTNGSGALSWADDNGNAALGYYDVNIGGANFDLGTGTDFASYTEITNSSGSLTVNSGSTSAGIACSAPATEVQEVGDTTCTGSEGDEAVGIVITPASTTVPLQLCIDFSHRVYDNATSQVADAIVGFQLAATENNSTTIVLQGKSRVVSTFITYNNVEQILHVKAIHLCGIFTFADTNVKRIVLVREQDVGGVGLNINDIFSDGSAAYGQPDIHIYGHYLK